PGTLPGSEIRFLCLELSLRSFVERRRRRLGIAIAQTQPLLHHVALVRREFMFVLVGIHELLTLIRCHTRKSMHLLTNRVASLVGHRLHSIEQRTRLLVLLGSHVLPFFLAL